jgi:two-component system sensor histidine kinase QseC
MAETRASSAYSLKRRLILTVLAAVALVWAGAAVYTYFDAQHEVDELLDAHLAQSASLLLAQGAHELDEAELEHAPALHNRARRVAFQVWERGTVLRLHSANAPQARLSAREQGYSSVRIDGRSWRVFSAWDARHRVLVQVGERDEVRREIVSGTVGSLLAPLVVALPLLGLAIWLGIGRALGPLGRLGREVAQREAGDFSPLAAPQAPREVLPLVRSLNALLERVGRLVETERRFTADAAHELRTPLAALKTQAQVARGATDDAQRRHALDSVIAGCDRAARLVEQLLTLARLDPGPGGRAAQPCELGALARQAIADLAPAALSRSIEIELAAREPVTVRGYADLLCVLLRNLVDNALRYSPAGSTVRVDVRRSEGMACVSVVDQGPGIAAEERAKVGQRFYRVLGTSEPGSGLGLSIVRRIAEIHGARLALEEPENGKGLRAVIALEASGGAAGV